jgi:hypothetical protein
LCLCVASFCCPAKNRQSPRFYSKGTINSVTGDAANISISLDGASEYTATTDNNGNFEIPGVEKGLYVLTYRKANGTDGSFSANALQLKVRNDTSIRNLLLPNQPIYIQRRI